MIPTLPNKPQDALAPLPAAIGVPDENVFVMPCSAAQVRFWQIDQLSGKQGAVFNVQLALSLTGPLRENVLQQTINFLVDRHEALRTSFQEINGEVTQVIAASVSVPLNVLDISGVPEDDKPARQQMEIQKEADRALPLGERPVFRPMLIKLSQKEHVLLLTLHHIVCDGWASGILVRELSVVYDAFIQGNAPGLPPLTIQYADYALWQREWVKTSEHEKGLAYWKEQLSQDLPVLDFPTDFPRRSGQAFPSTIETLLLPRELGELVKRFSREWDTTPFVILFATYILLLHRYTGQDKFIVGTTAANRTRVELEDIVGVFANPMILRADLSGHLTVRQLLNSTRDMVLGSFDHQEVPFETILQELETSGGVQHKPTIQAFFLFQKAFLQPAEFGGVTMKPIRSVTPGTTFEQTLAIIERGEGMRLQLDYNTDLFKPDTIRRFLTGFQLLLEGILAQPDAPVADLPLLTEPEKADLQRLCESINPSEFNGTWPTPGEVLMELDVRYGQGNNITAAGARTSITPESRVQAGALSKTRSLNKTGLLGKTGSLGKTGLSGKTGSLGKTGLLGKTGSLAKLGALVSGSLTNSGSLSRLEPANAGSPMKYLVLDERLRALPPGAPGTIYIAGLEPLSDPAQEYTWARGPVDQDVHVDLLKTEHLGRQMVNGKIEMLGKASDFVSFRGFQINLQEIEAYLLTHQNIVDCAAVKDEATGKLACYIVRKDESMKEEAQLRAFLKQRLSDLVPLAPIAFVSSIPRNSRGKVEVERLQVPMTKALSDKVDADPNTILYQQLADIWKDILKVPDVVLEDNFFDLGGSSFQAVRMMVQIEKVFGETLPLSLLLKGATLINLAQAISGKRQENGDAIQIVQSQGSRVPFLFLHGDWAGGGFYCSRIARAIGEGRPFYAIPPYRNSTNQIVSMEAMASHHVQAIKELLPKGPYVLGGYCIGATLAMEVARQLKASGDEVSHVFLVDPSLQRSSWLRYAWYFINRHGCSRGWSLKKRMAVHDRYPVALDRWLRLPWSEKGASLRHRFFGKESEGGAPTASSPAVLNTTEYGAYALANRLSVLRPLSVPTTFYYPLPAEQGEAHAKLSELDLAKVEVEELPGNHVTCITNHVSVLGAKLQAKLADIE